MTVYWSPLFLETSLHFLLVKAEPGKSSAYGPREAVRMLHAR